MAFLETREPCLRGSTLQATATSAAQRHENSRGGGTSSIFPEIPDTWIRRRIVVVVGESYLHCRCGNCVSLCTYSGREKAFTVGAGTARVCAPTVVAKRRSFAF